jgi:mono/diheme cytochrome c family protein
LAIRWALGFVCVGSVSVLAYMAAAWQPAIPPVDPPAAASFAPALVNKGKVLASAARCMDCHTTKDGQPGAGGRPFARLFGTIYSSNITPDAETGIGNWSLDAFARALRDGVARDGKHLFATALPIDHFTQLTDEDIGALYAYLMNLPPVKAQTPSNRVPFPFYIRSLQATWKAIYLAPGPYQPDATRDAQWNRGAYLAEAVAHCSSCHTPRNVLGAEEAGHPYGGALVDGWWASPLDVAASPQPWTRAQLVDYLRTGESVPHGVALEPMQKVVQSLRGLPDSDIEALAAYFTSFITYAHDQKAGIARATTPLAPRDDNERYGAQRYLEFCSSCHEKRGAMTSMARSPIGLSAAVWAEKPENYIRIVLDGITRDGIAPGPTMPGFREKLTDNDIAMIAGYLRVSRTTLLTWPWDGLLVSIQRLRAPAASSP